MYDYREDNKELTPVKYSSAAIKVLHFRRPAHNKCFRMHWHDRIELIRVHQGNLYVNYGTQTSFLQAGEMMFIPPRMPHRGYTSTEEVRYDVLMFDIRSFYNDSELCQKYFPAIFDGRAKIKNVFTRSEIIQCFDSLCHNWESDSLTVVANVYHLLALFCEHGLISYRTELTRDNTVNQMIDYIESHFSKDITAASMCEHFGYTATHFGRKFKESTGLTPMNYLKIYRMEAAYKLLKSGKRNIGEIATLCGYSDPNYFTRCFKNHFGIAPSQLKSYE